MSTKMSLLEDSNQPSELLDENASKPVPIVLFFLLGNASLLAYNIAINAIDIFSPLFSDLNINIGADISRSYNIPSAIISFLLIFFKPKNLRVSIVISLSILILVMCIMPILFSIESLTKQVRNLYWAVIIVIGCMAVFSSLVFSSTYAFASQCGEKASAAVSSGNGACGVIAAFLRVITKLTLSKYEDISSLIYYSVAAIVILLSLIYFAIVTEKNKDSISHYLVQESGTSSLPSIRDLLATIRIIWIEWSSVALNFVITLTLFPGYVTDTRQGKLGSWSFVLVTTVFCIFDWLGRFLPSVFMFPPRKFAWIPVVCRLLFFVVFMISIQGAADLGEPYWSILWQIPFALTNGYCGTVSLIYGSNHEKCDLEQRKQGSFLISFAINAGILLAMCLTYAMPAGNHL